MAGHQFTDLVHGTDPKTRRWKTTFAAARMAYDTGEFRQAESLLARAFEIAKELPESTYATNATEVGSAAVLLAEHRTREAEKRLQKSISKIESYPEAELKELLGVALRYHAEALSEGGDDRDVEQDLKRSVEILESLGQHAAVQLAYTWADLSALYLTLGRHSEAEKCINAAMVIASKSLDPETPGYVRVDMIYAACQPMTEESYFETISDGIQRMEYMYGAKHPNIDRALKKYFKVLEERGDTHKIDECAKRFGILAPNKGSGWTI